MICLLSMLRLVQTAQLVLFGDAQAGRGLEECPRQKAKGARERTHAADADQLDPELGKVATEQETSGSRQGRRRHIWEEKRKTMNTSIDRLLAC